MASRPTTPRWSENHVIPPDIPDDLPFGDLVRDLSFYFVQTISSPSSFEDLRTNTSGQKLMPLVQHLTDNVHHEAIIPALLSLKHHFANLESDDDRAVNDARGYACEYVAWRFVAHLSEREAIDFLLTELKLDGSESDSSDAEANAVQSSGNGHAQNAGEQTPLLTSNLFSTSSSYFGTDGIFTNSATSGEMEPFGENDFTSRFAKLNALEIAVVAEAKKFLSQKPVQRIINGIWRGDIVFWETLSVHSVKKAKIYNKRRADPFSRLRVPRYLKAFEVLFFGTFLWFYYGVLTHRTISTVTIEEVLLYIWIAGFAYNELGELLDAGQTAFYSADFWVLWDLGIIVLGLGFLILRIMGLGSGSFEQIDTAYDLLALEALLLIPRTFSLLSLHPYFGTLMPCLKKMTIDFCKFLTVVLILYAGFETSFTLLARDHFSPKEMSWILIKVFFGSSYLGFDVAPEISSKFGPAVMLIFIIMTNILLITSLISLLSNSLAEVLAHSREEYLFGYSVFVLQAADSNRLTYYLPPLNLLPLLFRPFRLVVSPGSLRKARIVLLKLTHFPYVAAIWAFEHGYDYVRGRTNSRGSFAPSMGGPEAGAMRRNFHKASLNSPRPRAQASHERLLTPTEDRRYKTANTESDEELKSLVTKLSTQVEQLTAMVAQLQAQQQPPPNDMDLSEQ